MHFGIVLGGIWAHFCLHFAIKIPSKNALEISSIFRSILGGIWAPLASHLAPKIAPKIDPGRPWSTESPLERAQEPQDPQKSPKMEPEVSPRPSKSTLWTSPDFQNEAPELPTWNPRNTWFPKMDSGPGNPKWFQNKSNIKPNKRKIQNQTRSNMEPTWHQILDSLIRPNVLTKLMSQRG